LTVKKIFGALRLGTEKSNLQKGAISASTAAGTDELNPIFKLCERAFKPGPVNLLKEPSSWTEKRSLARECQLVKETHHSMAKTFLRFPPLTNKNIFVQACLLILLKKINTIFLRKREFVDHILPAGKEFF
jgi:hypothetical protein